MPHLTINGVATAYSDAGSGPPLVFIHGAVQTLHVWQAQIAPLTESYRCIAYDLRGHGESELGQAPLTMKLFADDLLALLDALGIARATLCGVSLGGMIALHAAARSPERVAALALANTPVALSLSPTLLRVVGALDPYLLLRPIFRILGQARAGRIGLRLARSLMGLGWVSGVAEEHFLKGFSTMRPEAVVATYRAICEAGLPDLSPIRAPTLIVTGFHEADLVFRHAAEIARWIGRAELVTVPGGHVTNLDAPDAFNAALARFLATTARGGEASSSDPTAGAGLA